LVQHIGGLESSWVENDHESGGIRDTDYFKSTYIHTYEDLKNYKFTNNETTIPKIIFRTCKFKLNELYRNVKIIYRDDIIKNEGYTVFYFDDEDCKKSIDDTKNERLINAYNKLVPTAFKADLWRYVMLYTYGGIYLDHSHVANIKFDDIIKSEKEIFVKDKLDEYGINNSFIATCKNNKVLGKAIDYCIENIENETYDLKLLEITGSQLLEKCYKEIYGIDSNVKYIEMGMPSIKYKLMDYSGENKILGIVNENNEEIIKYKPIKNHYLTLYGDNFDSLHHSNLYVNKLVYADEKIDYIKKLYRQLLGRECDISGLINYHTHHLTEDIESYILQSEEYSKLQQ
jgi:mannosyltransferase OCH1-like enzyme